MRRKKRTLFSLFKIFGLAVLFLTLLAGVSAAYWILTLDVPDFQIFEFRKVPESTKIYDRAGEILLYDVHQDIKRTAIPFEKIPRHLKNATVAIEDSNFYQHRGINFRSILRAFLANLRSGKIRQGASTITQQLVKDALLTPERTFSRKIKEIILALKIEKKYSKDKILNFYLNEVYYGSSSFGAEAASQTFFGKPASELTLAESAYLAALPKAPSYYSPYAGRKKELDQRKNLVLVRMSELGFITSKEEKKAAEEKIVFRNPAKEGFLAPHFVMYVRDYLVEKYGKEAVEENGLKVRTTIDYELQQKAEELVKKWSEEQKKKYNAGNASLIGLDPKTGQILAMVGSADYFDAENEGNFNVATLGLRQPGSALKPFVYATLLQKGYTPDTILFDLATEFNPDCNADGTLATSTLEKIKMQNEDPEKFCYHPQNYDGKFRGPVTIREALAQSINVPAVKALYLASAAEAITLLRNAGITTLDNPNRYGLSLVLGGGEIKLLELSGAYSVFATDGVFNPPTPILRVEKSNGEVIEEFSSKGKIIFEQNVSRPITDILSDNEARVPAFGSQSYLYFPEYPEQVAAKTGTTNDYRDAWVFGYTKNFTLGVWFGNNDNSPMEKKVAGFIAAPLWNEFFREVFKKYPPEQFAPAEEVRGSKPVLNGEWKGSRVYLIDKISGKRATDYTPPEYLEERVLTEVHSILYWLQKDNPNSPIPYNPDYDPQFNNWEASVRKWVQEQGIKEETITDVPRDFDDVHKPEYQPRIFLLNENEIFDRLAGVLKINLSVAGFYPISKIDFYLGPRHLGSVQKPPYVFEYNLFSIPDLQQNEELIIRAFDEKGNRGEVVKVLTF